MWYGPLIKPVTVGAVTIAARSLKLQLHSKLDPGENRNGERSPSRLAGRKPGLPNVCVEAHPPSLLGNREGREL